MFRATLLGKSFDIGWHFSFIVCALLQIQKKEDILKPGSYFLRMRMRYLFGCYKFATNNLKTAL